MILIDALLPPNGRVLDMKIDENKTVFQMLEDISDFAKEDLRNSYVIATLRKGLLRLDLSLKRQGIHGGERLVIIPYEGGTNGNNN